MNGRRRDRAGRNEPLLPETGGPGKVSLRRLVSLAAASR